MRINLKDNLYWQTGLLIFGAYTALLVVNAPSVIYYNMQSQQPVEWWTLTARFVWGMYVWVFITPFILWMGYIFPITRRNLWRYVLIHLGVAVFTGLIRPPITSLGSWTMGINSLESIRAELLRPAMYLQSVTGAVVTYPSIIAIQRAYLYFRESQERAFNLQQAELQLLKMQLRPHFFFNTLNAISALIHKSPKDADRMIIQLGDIFRRSLKKDKTQEVSLQEELEFLQAFLKIHQTLMGKRLNVEWRVEPDTLAALVPNLILQPIAENAIQHGIAPLEEGGTITVCAEKQNGSLLLQMRDNGHGFAAAKENIDGIGLINTRSRLKNLYSGTHKFSIDESAGGVTVKIEIPFQEQAAEKK